MTAFHAPISEQIWNDKYRFEGEHLTDTWWRVAHALSAPETYRRDDWMEQFYDAMSDFKFLPAGRILSGAGTDRNVTLFNCYVMGTIPDSMDGIFTMLREAALTMQQGGGIGYDFSTLRPKGAPVRGVAADASGPLTFMDVWDAMCRTVMSAGSRRGAMMATMRCDHPDILDFIEAKRDSARLRMFNLSVLVTDEFMQAVEEDEWWPLCFGGVKYYWIPARDLWNKIMQATYDVAEPGVIFIDRINERNNLRYCETIAATNPCGEQPLPPYGACLLGSINLAALVDKPFTDTAGIRFSDLKRLVQTAVRMMDNVVDVSRYPLPQQEAEAKAKRRIGLGVTGLADALAMCRLRYGSEDAVERTDEWLAIIRNVAYTASVMLAKEKGPFLLFDADGFLAPGTFASTLDPTTQAAIREHGIRNSHLLSIAPTGTISLLAGNVSSGIEPIFATSYTRKVLQKDGSKRKEAVEDFAVAKYREHIGAGDGQCVVLPDYFTTAQELDPTDHVRMQAVAQKYVDSSISKTINVPADISFEAFEGVYLEAYRSGCKGCTTYRPNEVTGSVLSVEPKEVTTRSTDEIAAKAKVDMARIAAENPEDFADAGLENGIWPTPGFQFAVDTFHDAEPATSGEAMAALDYAIAQQTLPDRPEHLVGVTYKLKFPELAHALYITINDIVDEQGRRPFEIFINSKNMEHYAWTVALTRMVSAIFRRGGDVAFVAEELKQVFDPRGGGWVKGEYIPSVLAAIGGVIERHLKATVQPGTLRPLSDDEKADFFSGGVYEVDGASWRNWIGVETEIVASGTGGVAGTTLETTTAPPPVTCPACGSYRLMRQEGCETCRDCGHSKCG